MRRQTIRVLGVGRVDFNGKRLRMIELCQGDLFASGCRALVNPVNCVGVMGKGLALQFKQRFPSMFTSYKELCARRELQPGALHLTHCGAHASPEWIVNLPTKRHWKGKSTLADVEAGLVALKSFLVEQRVASVAVPALGAGLGGLEWEPVLSAIRRHLSELEAVLVKVYPPSSQAGAGDDGAQELRLSSW